MNACCHINSYYCHSDCMWFCEGLKMIASVQRLKIHVHGCLWPYNVKVERISLTGSHRCYIQPPHRHEWLYVRIHWYLCKAMHVSKVKLWMKTVNIYARNIISLHSGTYSYSGLWGHNCGCSARKCTDLCLTTCGHVHVPLMCHCALVNLSAVHSNPQQVRFSGFILKSKKNTWPIEIV